MRVLIRAVKHIYKQPLCNAASRERSIASSSEGSGLLQPRHEKLIFCSTAELSQGLGGNVEAIHGYRETERERWGVMCTAVLERLRTVAFPKGSTLLGPVHVLDLDKAGYIKPHIDSVKFCGTTIAGLSLLSDSIMRLVKEDDAAQWLDLLLPRRSLYILRDQARYKFTHEILRDEDSVFDGQRVPRQRRISVICRNLPS
ncbi:alpha-ketoglutarate-dependent dioxygenase alkB homolog 7, mitochondrial isoform X2 [Hypomesus transpacificus]|uniref:alpha-ketoglutarate-dependent dioxygenase alkB homolog 7, mitochondrial isoform X2 n=1 Tax=Hypomesus transpacificus TaxID=137520 RepID=UPI001F0807FD|nr:alpha-ketoglutarate-dependent dioxygenase alkB homolog 7, mitochondrial isoform X2 [Hypomesus transpacificus]